MLSRAHASTASCGIVEYAPAECPPPGSWVYVQAELTYALAVYFESAHRRCSKQNSANSNVYNVTLSGVTGFEVYLSTNVNCPSDSSCVLLNLLFIANGLF